MKTYHLELAAAVTLVVFLIIGAVVLYSQSIQQAAQPTSADLPTPNNAGVEQAVLEKQAEEAKVETLPKDAIPVTGQQGLGQIDQKVIPEIIKRNDQFVEAAYPEEHPRSEMEFRLYQLVDRTGISGITQRNDQSVEAAYPEEHPRSEMEFRLYQLLDHY